MSEQAKDENQEEFDPEVLLNPELLDEFINMFSGRLAHAAGEKIKKEKEMKDWENTEKLLQAKLDVLLKYKKFQALKGFGYTKQTADEFFENMSQANQNRIHFEDAPGESWNAPKCNGSYLFMQMEYQCSKQKGHLGPCGAY